MTFKKGDMVKVLQDHARDLSAILPNKAYVVRETMFDGKTIRVMDETGGINAYLSSYFGGVQNAPKDRTFYLIRAVGQAITPRVGFYLYKTRNEAQAELEQLPDGYYLLSEVHLGDTDRYEVRSFKEARRTT